MCCAQDLPGFLRRGYFSLQEYHRRSFSTRKPAHRCSAVIQVSYSASYNVGRRPLVGPLRKAAWSSGSLWPNRPGDHSTRKRTWWGRPLGDFQGRINPRLIQTDALPACRLRFAREAHTCQVGNRAHALSGIIFMGIVAAATLYVAYSIYVDVEASGTQVSTYTPFLLLFVALLIALAF